MDLQWDSPIQFVKKVGPRRAESLAREGAKTAGDLLLHAPFRYEDRIDFRPIATLREGEFACVCGKIIASGTRTTTRQRMKLFEIVVRDPSGALNVVFFNQPYLNTVFKDGTRVILYGRAERDQYAHTLRLQFKNPDHEIIDADSEGAVHMGRIVPVYRKLGLLTSRQLREIIHGVLQAVPAIPDPLPPELIQRLGLPERAAALHAIHFPSLDNVSAPERPARLAALDAGDTSAHRRMIFEEFFLLQTGLQFLLQQRQRETKAHRVEITAAIREKVRRMLPFKPTGAQKRVIREIVDDMKQPWPMNRLLQGDVGSGKTIVAVQAMVVAVENGLQAVLMAPTEILADQHHAVLSRLLAESGYRVALLRSGLPPSERQAALGGIADGSVQVVVGTHSVIQKEVNFQRLGLAIVDEQHRFGVLQRAELIRKGATPDILVMTATPIPRTLALTVYGDLSLSVIDEMPPGRVPIRTLLLDGVRDARRAWAIIREELRRGNQAYVVYPLIEESEKVDLRDALEGARQLSAEIFPDFRVGLLHGRMSEAEKDAVMGQFREGQLRLLVSTTVIEVGVDVPDATVMAIQHAERFGLSQLHQLRGRIGRSDKPAQCLLLAYDAKTEESQRRLEVMVQTTDGFRIAEEDLAIRGPGEFSGTRQSGVLNFRFGSILRHRQLLEQARQEAESFVKRALADFGGSEARWLANVRGDWAERFGLILVG